MIRYRRLPFPCDLEALRADLAAVAPEGWHPHFNQQYYSGDWSGIPLRGIPGSHVPLYSDPTRSDFADTGHMSRCRYVPALLDRLQCPVEAVRFLKLAPGAVIREHRDFGLCLEEGALRLHIPVYTNADVDFLLDDEPLTLTAGECWYVNFDLKHRLANRGHSDRVHLVIDARVNAWVNAWFERAHPVRSNQSLLGR